MSLITCENLSLAYGGRLIVRDLNFRIESDDYLCIVGENGSGKTTLMKSLLNLIQPAAGRIILGDGLKANEIGYLPQQHDARRDFPASVREVVRSGCLNRSGFHPFYSREEKAYAEEQMRAMGIVDLAQRRFGELSGGQQQRVLLARALCASEKLLLMDEPVTGLDPDASSDFYQLIHEQHIQGIAIVMISHDVHRALSEAKHILHLGLQSSFYGTSEAYAKSPHGCNFLLRREAERKAAAHAGAPATAEDVSRAQTNEGGAQ